MVLMSLSAGQQWRRRHREQVYGHRVGKEREGKMERVDGNIYTTIGKIDSQWEFAV